MNQLLFLFEFHFYCAEYFHAKTQGYNLCFEIEKQILNITNKERFMIETIKLWKLAATNNTIYKANTCEVQLS